MILKVEHKPKLSSPDAAKLEKTWVHGCSWTTLGLGWENHWRTPKVWAFSYLKELKTGKVKTLGVILNPYLF
jgi:hypothetical protein